MQEAQKRLDLAFKAFFRRVKTGEKPGYPRFRGHERYDSFTYPQEKGNWRFLENGRLRLSKVGEIKIKLHRPLVGTIKTLTIRCDAVGNWYACFSCIVEPKPQPVTDRVVGIDVGLSHFATLSNGEQIDNPRFFRQDEKALAAVQRRLSKETKGTPQFQHRKRAVNHVHQRIAQRRKNFAHQQARSVIDYYQIIAFEKLDIAAMQADNPRRLNKSIGDVAWHQFVRSCASKAAEAGRTVVLVAPRHTTKACSACGELVPKALAQRLHVCPNCGLVLDRDHNAALNILARGLASMGNQSLEAPSPTV
jgi:putative transposase